MDAPTPRPQPARFDRSSAFSYECRVCQRCCRHKLIRINPYEALRLARALNLSTTEFLARCVERERSVLYQFDDGRCIFLDPQRGCTVHADRPLVCRLYPLGRHVSGTGVESFSTLEPHPQSEGRWGTAGTVGDFLEAQQARDFLDATDRMLTLYDQLRSHVEARAAHDAPAHEADQGQDQCQDPGLDPERALDWMDIDAVLAEHGRGGGELARGAAADVQAAFEAFLEILARQTELGLPDRAHPCDDAGPSSGVVVT